MMDTIRTTDIDAWAMTDIDSELSVLKSSAFNYALYGVDDDVNDDFDMLGEVELDFN